METIKNIIASRVVDYFSISGEAKKQIPHTIAVASYTRLIAFNQGLNLREQTLLEIAAWLHDIGCPKSREIYGNTLPVHQMAIGERIVNEWFSTNTTYPDWSMVLESISKEECLWIARVVGTHHQKAQAETLHYEPLFEADVIANQYEENHKEVSSKHIYEHMLFSEEGKKLFRRIVWNEE